MDGRPSVVLADGAVLPADVVVAATGFEQSLDLLAPALLGLFLVVPFCVLTSRPGGETGAPAEPLRPFADDPALVSRTERLVS